MQKALNTLAIQSVRYRKKILQYIKLANAGHTGGSLSCIDILNVLYNKVLNVSPENFTSPDRDRFIQSKGHCVEALYVVLADKGFFPTEDLETLCQYQSHYIGHPMATGMAIAARMDKKDFRVFTLLGDGELPEGSNWEAALTASHYQLDNLCAIIDKNGLQISGKTSSVCNTDPIDKKFESFGWATRSVDGNDTEALEAVFASLPFEAGKPSLIIAHTTKGKGISFMENELKWHHGVPNDEQYRLAQLELDEQLNALEHG